MGDSDQLLTLRPLERLVSERPADVVLVVGAGLSAQAGLPGWSRLVSLLVSDAKRLHSERIASGLSAKYTPDFFAHLDGHANKWAAMQELKQALGENFTRLVREHLKFGTHPEPPPALTHLWSLGIKGIVTPNLDTLASDAYSRAFRRSVDTGTLRNTKYLEFLADERRFVFQPHGELSDPDSWMLTTDALAPMLRDSSYRGWWRNLLASRTLLFLGIDSSDLALTTFILDNSTKREHYVLAPASAEPRIRVSEYSGFNITWYKTTVDPASGTENHSELDRLLGMICKARPTEAAAPSVMTIPPTPPAALPPPNELQRLPPAEQRRLLNEAVAVILPPDEDGQEGALRDFDLLRKKYLPMLRSAMSVEPDSEYDTLYHYRLDRVLGSGQFSTVYLATDVRSGTQVAAKIIHPQIIQSGPHLNAFRRGAHAMRVLTSRRIPGMVRFIEGFEVPSTIIMEHIDGLDLEHAIESGAIASLPAKLRLVRRIAEIVDAAHSVPEQVLHRDLKPANVLLSGYTYVDAKPEDIVSITDFDLCWHRFASATTIIHKAGSQGYAAPEFANRTLGSTRSASVDAYGTGMILMFVLLGQHPEQNAHNSVGFEDRIANEIRLRYSLTWSSTARHLARCVVAMTQHRPSERASLQDFMGMLDVAIAVEQHEDAERYLPIIAMQIMEGAIGEGKVASEEFGRVLTYRKLGKELKVSVSSSTHEVLVEVTVTIEKDVGQKGSDQIKRDERMGASLRKAAESAGISSRWVATASLRTLSLTHKLPRATTKEVRRVSTVVAAALERIDKSV